MSRTFSIYLAVLLEEILEEINAYIMTTGEQNPYLFMSADTMRTIYNANAWKLKETSTRPTLYGYKVFIDNDLRYGAIEIR